MEALILIPYKPAFPKLGVGDPFWVPVFSLGGQLAEKNAEQRSEFITASYNIGLTYFMGWSETLHSANWITAVMCLIMLIRRW